MNVLILGMGGVGTVIAGRLAREEWVSKIIGGSRNGAAVPALSSHHKIQFKKIDAGKAAAIAAIARGIDLIINASLPQYNVPIMKAALLAGAHYQDLCSYLKDLQTPEQLQFHSQFKMKKLTGLINTGISPGITNLLAAEGAAELCQVSSIKIRMLEEQQQEMFAWSPQITMLELTATPLLYHQGKNTFCPSFSGMEHWTFPTAGKRKVYAIYGDEVATLPRYIKVQNIDYKSGGAAIENMRRLLKTYSPEELLERVPHPAASHLKQATARCIMSVEISGEKTIRYDVLLPDSGMIAETFPGANYITYPTGVAAAVFAKYISALEPGVYPPEGIPAGIRKKIIKDLQRAGIKIRRQVYYTEL